MSYSKPLVPVITEGKGEQQNLRFFSVREYGNFLAEVKRLEGVGEKTFLRGKRSMQIEFPSKIYETNEEAMPKGGVLRCEALEVSNDNAMIFSNALGSTGYPLSSESFCSLDNEHKQTASPPGLSRTIMIDVCAGECETTAPATATTSTAASKEIRTPVSKSAFAELLASTSSEGAREKEEGPKKDPALCSTIMFRSLPVEWTPADLMRLLSEAGFEKGYDYLFVPRQKKVKEWRGTPENKSYAWVNFATPELAAQCLDEFCGVHEGVTGDFANLQGLRGNIEEFHKRYMEGKYLNEPKEWWAMVFKNGEPVSMTATFTDFSLETTVPPVMPKSKINKFTRCTSDTNTPSLASRLFEKKLTTFLPQEHSTPPTGEYTKTAVEHAHHQQMMYHAHYHQHLAAQKYAQQYYYQQQQQQQAAMAHSAWYGMHHEHTVAAAHDHYAQAHAAHAHATSAAHAQSPAYMPFTPTSMLGSPHAI